MSQRERSNGDDRDDGGELNMSRLFHVPGGERDVPTPPADAQELEPGWRAARALMRLKSDELLAVMLRPSFRMARALDLVPVERCPYCQDGGLRTAGSVRLRTGRGLVRACDTCARLAIERTTKMKANPDQ